MVDDDQLRQLQARADASVSVADGLAASRELLETLVPLAEHSPDTYAPQLATAWKEYGTRLALVAGPSAGLAPVTTAVDMFRQLATGTNPVSLVQLAFALQALAQLHLQRAGAAAEALPALAQAHQLCGQMARHDPQVAAEVEACVEHLRATAYSLLGDHDRVLACAQRAEAGLRRVERRLPVYSAYLADTLKTVAVSLFEKDQIQAARRKIEDAQWRFRRLAKRDPAGYLGEYANATYLYATVLLAQGKQSRAVGTYHTAVELYARAVPFNPALREEYRQAAASLVKGYEELGRPLRAAKLRQQHGL